MRSIIKLLSIIAGFILLPLFLSFAFSGIDEDFKYQLIGQIIMMVIMIFVFFVVLNLHKQYEKKTNNEIADAESIDALKDLRDKKFDYKSKAKITKEILIKEPSNKEAENLKKYTNTAKDMDHYYAYYISNADSKTREEFKIRRDNFKRKYGQKRFIYLDFKGNLKTAFKWILAFFIIAVLTNLFGNIIILNSNNNPDHRILAIYMLGQMILLAAFMINSIIWLSRSLRSFWDKDYI